MPENIDVLILGNFRDLCVDGGRVVGRRRDAMSVSALLTHVMQRNSLNLSRDRHNCRLGPFQGQR